MPDVEKVLGAEKSQVQLAIEEHVAAQASRWYPGLGSALRITSRTLSVRPSCELLVITVSGEGANRRVLAKVRRGEPEGEPGTSDRPRLRTVPGTIAELTSLEYQGLVAIEQNVGSASPSFRALRPLDHMPAESAVLMEFVDLPTLRQAFLAESRLARVPGFRQRSDAPAPKAWHNAGAWLRSYHDSGIGSQRPHRQAHRRDVVERFGAFGDYLAAKVGRRDIGKIAFEGADRAAELLPERLPLSIGHGDYAPRNMFVDDRGRIMVFDPMPRWQVPRYEDLCRFLVGMRMSGLQVHTHGAAYGARHLQEKEDLFLTGYFGSDEVPHTHIWCYQLLIVLDKWSALTESARGRSGLKSRLRGPLDYSVNAQLEREARRLLGSLAT